MPVVEQFMAAGKCVEVDSSKARVNVYELVKQRLSAFSVSYHHHHTTLPRT